MVSYRNGVLCAVLSVGISAAIITYVQLLNKRQQEDRKQGPIRDAERMKKKAPTATAKQQGQLKWVHHLEWGPILNVLDLVFHISVTYSALVQRLTMTNTYGVIGILTISSQPNNCCALVNSNRRKGAPSVINNRFTTQTRNHCVLANFFFTSILVECCNYQWASTSTYLLVFETLFRQTNEE